MRIDMSTVLIIWILISSATPLFKSEYITEDITVINSTATELSISWTVLTNQSISLIEYYNITLQADVIILNSLVFQVFPSQIENITNNTFEYTIGGLQEFITYNIQVLIVISASEVFTSRASTNGTTEQQVPSGAPQSIMSLAMHSTTIQVYWYPPPVAEQNGLITHYTLTYAGALFNDRETSVEISTTDAYPATSLQGPYNITGLQEYNNYSIVLQAVNGIGVGPSSARAIQLTNQAAPDGSPLNLTVGSINSTAIYLTWSPPPGATQNGPITHYNISHTGSQLDTSTRFRMFTVSPPQYPADTIEHSYNLTGLEEFTNYSIAISAVNVAGMGPPSVSVLATTEEDAPDAAPINITAIAIDSTRIQVSWHPPPPVNQNGEISHYNITTYGAPFDTAPLYSSFYMVSRYPDTTNYTSILIGFQEYNNYTVSISAVNSEGQGPGSQGITVLTEIGASDLPPQSLTPRSINATSILITWLPPPPLNQNGPILFYNITFFGVIYDTNPRSIIFNVAQPTYPTNSSGEVSIGRLSPYTSYSIGVSAATPGGIGVFNYTRQRTAEAAPTGSPLIIRITPSATEVNISWSPPSNTEQNGIITRYVIFYNASLFSNLTGSFTFPPEFPSYPDTATYTQTVFGLEGYVLYSFKIQAFTMTGGGPNSLEETSRTTQAVPGAPVLITVSPVNMSEVTVRWKHPDKINQNGPILRYHISYIRSMSSATRVFTYNLTSPIAYPADPSTPLSAILTIQLDPGVYVWYVTAENGAGISAKSNNITRVVLGDALPIVAVSISTAIGACCIFIISPIVLIYVLVLVLLFRRRSQSTKITTIEATTVEMKSRTIFSNQGSLKELEKQEVTKEAIYVVIGDNQPYSESVAGESVVVTIEDPVETPIGDEVGLSTSLTVANEGTDIPAVVIIPAEISGEYIGEPILHDESKLLENTEEHSLDPLEQGEVAEYSEQSMQDEYVQDQESQII